MEGIKRQTTGRTPALGISLRSLPEIPFIVLPWNFLEILSVSFTVDSPEIPPGVSGGVFLGVLLEFLPK